jgi:TorA maturation chaperone TorD
LVESRSAGTADWFAIAWLWAHELDEEWRERLPPPLAQAAAGVPLFELAAEHCRVLQLALAPFESVYIDPSGMLLAPATSRVEASFNRWGWSPPSWRVAAPDHVAIELAAVAALEDVPDGAAEIVRGHLAWWVPLLVEAVRELRPHPFYGTLAETTERALMAALAATEAALSPRLPTLPDPPRYRATPFDPPPDQAAAESGAGDGGRSGWAGLARRLATTRRAGFVLSGARVARVARALDLPAAPGDRVGALADLFRAAEVEGRWRELVAALENVAADAAARYGQVARTYPAWHGYATEWTQVAETTAALLRQVRDGAESGSGRFTEVDPGRITDGGTGARPPR